MITGHFRSSYPPSVCRASLPLCTSHAPCILFTPHSLDARMLQLRTKRLVVLLERNPLRQPSTDENAVQLRVPSLLELCMREMLNSRPWAPRDLDVASSGPSLRVSLHPGGSRLNTPGRPLTQSSMARPTTADDAALESKARRSWIERQPLSSHVKRLLTMADHCASCNRYDNGGWTAIALGRLLV